ncbi:MAG: M48 family metallopeptidase [Alteromonadaceae bacterium]|nr:M48 family metallopeptidase [Alteromonadaceae bacterium]
MLDYQLVRSARRKTLLLQVKQGKVTVRAPLRLPLAQIKTFINDKSAWIKQKLAEQYLTSQQSNTVKPMVFTHNSILFYLGTEYRLNIEYAQKSIVHIKQSSITVVLSYRQQKNLKNTYDLAQQVKKSLAVFFKQQLHNYLLENLPILASKCQLSPKFYKIRFYKTRWGSCNSRGELNFNYLLMLLPSWVIDYVVVHELCHLQQLNHSLMFWQLVEQHYPDYKAAIVWLKTHQQRLIW